MALQMTVSESTNGPRELAEDGVYKVRLASIEVKSEENPFKTDEYGNHPIEDKFLWTFETTEAVNSEGKPFKFWRSTGTSYGNEKANLTLLVDDLLGRHLSADEAAEFDIQSLEGKTFNAMVSNEISQKGNPFNKLVKVKRIGGNAKPAAAASAPKAQMAAAGRRTKPAPLGLDDGDDDDSNPFNAE